MYPCKSEKAKEVPDTVLKADNCQSYYCGQAKIGTGAETLKC
jgi:hypothetical protein